MIPRVLEPEAMETAEDVRQYDAMDHSEVNARFVDDFLAAHGPCRGGEILDVGTGTARIPIALAGADSQARVLALDLSETMLAQADDQHRRGRIDLADPNPPRAMPRHSSTHSARVPSKGVISNTIIHHIPDPVPALETMARLVAAGGTLMVRDLATSATRGPRSDGWSILTPPAKAQEARALFEASLHAALTLEEIRALIAGLGLHPDDVAMTSDRHWTWTWRRITVIICFVQPIGLGADVMFD